MDVPEIQIEGITERLSYFAELYFSNSNDPYYFGQYNGAKEVAQIFLPKDWIEAIEERVKEDLGMMP